MPLALAANLPAARASGILPPGYAGDSAYGTISREVDALLHRLGPALAEPALPQHAFAIESDGWRLSGSFTDVRQSALVRYRAAKLKAKDRVQAWVAHLALQLAAPAGHPRVTIFHSTDATLRFQPIDNAGETLADLLRFYARGIRAPLPFFAETSWDFAARTDGLKSGKSDPLEAAGRVWLGGEFQRGESADGWNQLAFRGVDDPLDATFQEIALAVLRPMFAAMDESK
jgi:exodeoxyribonuclease V gamma subunit